MSAAQCRSLHLEDKCVVQIFKMRKTFFLILNCVFYQDSNVNHYEGVKYISPTRTKLPINLHIKNTKSIMFR